jgi:hypothetical protein
MRAFLAPADSTASRRAEMSGWAIQTLRASMVVLWLRATSSRDWWGSQRARMTAALSSGMGSKMRGTEPGVCGPASAAA